MTFKPLIPAALLTVLALGGALPVAAQDTDTRRQGPDFATLDADGDGQVTEAELQARGDARFAAADADGDGLLTAEEMVSHVKGDRVERVERRVERLIEDRDSNADGALSRAELGNERGGRMLERADSNNDGAISREEFAELRERHDRGDRAGRHGRHHDGNGEKRGPRGGERPNDPSRN